jgi:glycosyltransferase involved in cell wall biosynthesis
MKIGINASFSRKANSGIGQVTINFIRKLISEEAKNKKRKNKHEFILYLEEDFLTGVKLPENFQKKIFLPIYKRDDLIRKIWWEKYLLPKKIEKDRCGVFFSLYQCPTILRKSIKHLMLVHDIIPGIFPEYLDNSRKKYYQKLTEKAIKKATLIMTVSQHTQKDLIQRLGILAKKIFFNYISVDESFRQKIPAEKRKNILKKYKINPGYIFAGGGMEKRKNIDGVLRAYKILSEKNKSKQFIKAMPKLVIYGELLPNLSLAIDVEKLVQELNLEKQVRFLKIVPQADLPVLFKNALFFVYPSHYEGFGIPVLESMTQGTPVVCAKNSSLPEVGSDGVLYCNSCDIREIACAMEKILKNEKMRKTLSDRGFERSNFFSWNKFVEKFYHLIENEL